MKIAQIVASFPPDVGGMGQVVFDETKELAKKGHDMTVFTLSYNGTSYQDSSFSFKVVRKKPLIRSGVAGFWPSLINLVKEFDVIHLHFPFYGGAEWVWLASVLGRRTYYVTYHMDAAPTSFFKKAIQTVYDAIFSNYILKNAKRIILVDPNQPLKFKSKYLNKIVILPNGVDTDLFSLKNYTSVPQPILLFVGNLMKVKGLDVLLEAMTKVEGIKLVIVGGGYEERILKEKAKKLKIDGRVKWAGLCTDREKLAKIYDAAGAVVIPSFSESYSLVAGESLASGKPVIASDIPGIRNRVIDGVTGYTFKPGSSDELANAINKLFALSLQERIKMGLNGRKLVEDKFSLRLHLNELEAIYKI